MENQHRKIKGYRELSQEEIDLMNRIKEAGENLRLLMVDVEYHIGDQYDAVSGFTLVDKEAADEHQRLVAADPARWLYMAQDQLQTGIMYLVRSVAQPTTF